jgi:large subunit ribosomal protein L18Ae
VVVVQVGRSLTALEFDPQILRVQEIEKTADVKRPYIRQLLVPKLRFPLPHRVAKTKSTFVANRPATF